MCGRYALGLARNDIQQLDGYNLDIGEWVDEDAFVPRYNIAPRTFAPVIRRTHDDNNDALTLHSMKFGLVPHWSKHEDPKLKTFNARSENLVEGGGMWESMKRTKRCIVVAQGYFEWLKKGKDRIPHFIKHKNGKLMLFAGLYDCARLQGVEKPLWSFTIVTTSTNNEFSWLHDRQPVILSSYDAITTWLDPSRQSWTPEFTKLVEPYTDSTSPLLCYPVPMEVGKVGTQSPTFIEPISQRKDGIQAMFSKQQISSQHKRKRSSSLVDKPLDHKKAKFEDEDSDIELLGATNPATSSKNIIKTETKSPKMKSSSQSRTKPAPAQQGTQPSPSATKITDFFKS